MTSYDRGNISPLEMSFRNLKERTDALLTALRQDYRQSLSGNVIYRHYSFGRLVWTLLLITAAAYLLTKPALCSDAVQRFAAAYETATAQSIHEFQEPILGLVKMILLLFTVSQIVTVFRYFYSKHIERGNRQVTAIEKTVEKRMQAMQSQSGFLEQAKRAALGNDADFKADTPNDLGEKLIALHERFTASGKTSVRIRKIFGSLLSAFYYLFGFFVIWQHWEELRKFSAVPLLLLTCFSAYTYFTIDIVLCNIGEYLGKLMRPFGCLLAAVYCGFLYYTVGSEYTAHPLQLQLSQGKTVLPVTTGQLMDALAGGLPARPRIRGKQAENRRLGHPQRPLDNSVDHCRMGHRHTAEGRPDAAAVRVRLVALHAADEAVRLDALHLFRQSKMHQHLPDELCAVHPVFYPAQRDDHDRASDAAGNLLCDLSDSRRNRQEPQRPHDVL